MKQWFSGQEMLGRAGLPERVKGLLEKTSREGWQSRPPSVQVENTTKTLYQDA